MRHLCLKRCCWPKSLLSASHVKDVNVHSQYEYVVKLSHCYIQPFAAPPAPNECDLLDISYSRIWVSMLCFFYNNDLILKIQAKVAHFPLRRVDVCVYVARSEPQVHRFSEAPVNKWFVEPDGFAVMKMEQGVVFLQMCALPCQIRSSL